MPVSSSLARARRSATSSSSRSLSPSTVVATAGQSARCGCRLATSTVVRMVASGLRSSWEASDTNWRWRCWAASRRSSMSFMVWASRATSSSVAGSSMRRCSVVVADLLHLLAHALDGVQGPAHQPPRDDTNQQDQQRDADPQRRRQRLDAAPHLLEGGGGHDRVAALGLHDRAGHDGEAAGRQPPAPVPGGGWHRGRTAGAPFTAAGADLPAVRPEHLEVRTARQVAGDLLDRLAGLQLAGRRVEGGGGVVPGAVGELALDGRHEHVGRHREGDADERGGHDRDPPAHRSPGPPLAGTGASCWSARGTER